MGAFLRMIFSFIAVQAIMGSLRKFCEPTPEIVEQPPIQIDPQPQLRNVQAPWESPQLPGQLPENEYGIEVNVQFAPDPNVLNQIRVIEDNQP